MRDVVLFIAMSLDGYIASPDGGIDWLGGESKESSDSGSYERFIAGTSDIVMGHTTYRQLTTQLLPAPGRMPRKRRTCSRIARLHSGRRASRLRMSRWKR